MATTRFVAKHDEFNNLILIGYTPDGRPMYAAKHDGYKSLQFIGYTSDGRKKYRSVDDEIRNLVLIGYTSDGRPKYAAEHDSLKIGRAVEYEVFFGEMYLTEEEMRKRIGVAVDLDDVFEFLFWYLEMFGFLEEEYNEHELVEEVARRFRDALEENKISVKKYDLDDYIIEVIEDTITSTKNAKGTQEVAWSTSNDRAQYLAENITNVIANKVQYVDAKSDGFVTKQWHTMLDNRVRLTHTLLEQKRVQIDEPFEVGKSLMQYPGDTSLGADMKEIINCRCTVTYER